MSNLADEPGFDSERSRAAVAVACLRWLNCTGPAIEPGVQRSARSGIIAERPPIARTNQAVESGDSPHPLWDRWIDG